MTEDLADRDERLRAEGRRQANDAINWDTTCVGCANRLDGLYAERVEGYEDAARQIAREIRALYDQSGDRGLLQGLAIALKHAGKPAESSTGALAPPSGHTAEGPPLWRA